MKFKLTITVRASGYIELLNDDGVWFGPGPGGFRSTVDARNWANGSGYSVARSINRVS